MQYGIWSPINELFILSYIKIQVYFAFWIECFPVHTFIKQCTNHLENTISETCRPPKYWYISLYSKNHICYTHKKITFVAIKKWHSLILESCQTHRNGYKFSQILIFTQKLTFHHWQLILSVVCLEKIASLLSFLRICLPISQLVCQSFFQVKIVFHLKKSTTFEIVTQTIPQVLFLKTTIPLLYVAKYFMHASHSITEYIKNTSSSVER